MLLAQFRFPAVLALLAATPLFAAEPSAPQPIRPQPLLYGPEFFARFSPRTALDMVRQVPSFSLRDIDVEKKRRGLSGSAGNVLVDGAQPSAKHQTLKDILQRIPAAQVVRIEVLRGTETVAGASADSVLVNVVRTPTAGAGFWSAGFEYAQQHKPAPNGVLSWTGRIGNLDYGLGVSSYSLRREQPGTRRVTDGGGDLTKLRYETSPREFAEYAINGEASHDFFAGRLRVTGQASKSHYHQANTLDDYAPDGLFLHDQLAPYAEDKHGYELGTHFERATSSGDWTLAAIVTRNHFDNDIRLTDRSAALEVESIYQQLQVRDSGESIVRSTMTVPLGSSQQLQFGAEAALNTLDADLELTGIFGGVVVPIDDVPNATMRVEEKRGEAFVAHTRRRNAWSTEARLAVEYSRLDFSGDATRSVDLSYLKPSLQVACSFGAQDQVRVRVARDVGQLDFTDFASVVSLTDDRIDGGNPDLEPQTSWRAEVALDLHLSAQTALTARLFHDWLQDVVDVVQLEGTSRRVEAPGNVGDGELNGLQLTFATPLTPVIPGGTLKLDTTLQDARVTDPLTGRTRWISELDRNKVNAEFRQDTRYRGLAWGIKYERASSLTDYRLDQTDRTRKSPSLELFAEANVFGATKLRVSMIANEGSPELRQRSFYDGDRNGALTSIEDSRSRPGHWFIVTMSGSL